jgi:hypothetical protein
LVLRVCKGLVDNAQMVCAFTHLPFQSLRNQHRPLTIEKQGCEKRAKRSGNRGGEVPRRYPGSLTAVRQRERHQSNRFAAGRVRRIFKDSTIDESISRLTLIGQGSGSDSTVAVLLSSAIGSTWPGADISSCINIGNGLRRFCCVNHHGTSVHARTSSPTTRATLWIRLGRPCVVGFVDDHCVLHWNRSTRQVPWKVSLRHLWGLW